MPYAAPTLVAAEGVRKLRGGKEYSGLTAREERLVLNIDSSSFFQNAYSNQLQAEADDEQATDQPISLRAYPFRSRPPTPKLIPLEDLAAPTLRLSPLQQRPQYCPDYSLTPGERRKQKSKHRERAKRAEERLKAQQAAKSSLKACVLPSIRSAFKIRLALKKALQHPQGVWTGRRTELHHRAYSVQEVLKIRGMQLVKWEGRDTKVFEDAKGVPLIAMCPTPKDARWPSLVKSVHSRFLRAGQRLNWSKAEHRRGGHMSVPMGLSFGGGQTAPANFAHTPHNEWVLSEVRNSPEVKRVAGLCTHYLQSYFPQIHSLYENVLQQLENQNPSLQRCFPNSCFAAANINVEKAVTFRHVDYLNLIFGLCAVFPTGNFDYQRGGHLVLWDLGLVLEFPPGTVILLPSALLEHSNTCIADGESRCSLTFYSASGLFRWCHNGGMSDKDFKSNASAEVKQLWDQHRQDLWSTGLSLLKPKAV